MKLSEVLKQLSYGELAQLAIGEMNGDEWPKENKERLITHINAALTAIHKRFFLKEKRQTVLLTKAGTDIAGNPIEEVLTYSLEVPDLIRIEQVLDDQGEEIPLNVVGSAQGVSTPNYRTVQFPPRVEANQGQHPLDRIDELTVVYRATARLEERAMYFPPSMVDVDLPEVYLEPLLYYVAMRLQAPVGMDGQQIASNNYMAKYEQACRQLESEGYDISGTDPGEAFSRNGWI